ncbi:type II restriction enzyme, partial [Candidatus Magnetomorum sp. HK-1]
MNTSKIKAYAPQARNDFIQAVTERANLYGIFDDQKIEPFEAKGDVALIGDRPFSKKEGVLRERLVSRVKREGFQQVVEAYAYTWFNRFVALRYMELHDYLEHGFRVLSNQIGSDVPEILENAAEVEFEGLKKEKVIELRLAGNKDNDLYRLLIVAQCNALHKAMPFLFDKIDNETELLLPDNLLHSNSPIRKLVNDIDEESWQDVEIIGWIYQFYISEKKDQVIGKVVKSEDIPAATQLFTPNWIVKYMVQNTLGRMWLATYPDSGLRDKMEYYIEPAEQEPEVQAELDRITPGELNPEEITFLDPACGSGHILIEAYGIFKEIYLERGYRTRDIPRLILQKNIFGLDICDRASQLACFAVLMKAREDDRRILRRDDLKLNVMAIQEGKTNANYYIEMFFSGDEHQDVRNVLKEMITLFENSKTFGSLINISEHIVRKIEYIKETIDEKLINWTSDREVQILREIANQTWILSKKYDCVVTNPPYMGGKGMNQKLKSFAKDRFPDSKSDLFAIFIERALDLLVKQGFVGMITMQSWMFLSSYEKIRESILNKKTLLSMAHLGARAFDSIGGEVVSTTTFILTNTHNPEFKGGYLRLVEGNSEAEKKIEFTQCIAHASDTNQKSNFHLASSSDFKKIPGSPIAYWVGISLRNLYSSHQLAGVRSQAVVGLQTGNNDRFMRFWYEVDRLNINYNFTNTVETKGYHTKWVPYNKGGSYRKWYGNREYVVNWKDDGNEIRNFKDEKGKLRSRPQNTAFYFREAITWSEITSSWKSFRYNPPGSISDVKGQSAYFLNKLFLFKALAWLNSNIIEYITKVLNPTMSFQSGDYRNLPMPILDDTFGNLAQRAVNIAKIDWDSYEISSDFKTSPLIRKNNIISKSYLEYTNFSNSLFTELITNEKEINNNLINEYHLQNEFRTDVEDEQVTLSCNPHYRYGSDKTEEELETLLQTDTIKELISYTIGCMMGRYSLDHPGLIYAHS